MRNMRTTIATIAIMTVFAGGASQAFAAQTVDPGARQLPPFRMLVAERDCVKYVVKKNCVKEVTEVEETHRGAGPDPERELEFTLREKCVRWEEERQCVQWSGDTNDLLPAPGR
jgi:hypothetical protein